MDNRPIGVMDSGVGGLTVLKEIIKSLPNESYIFIGDQPICRMVKSARNLSGS